MSNICINCVKDSHLKQLVSDDGGNGVCSLCGSSDLVMNTENNKFLQLTKTLVRFYYSEWEYNDHWGGDGYTSLFVGEDNRFFNVNNSSSAEAYDDLVLSITEAAVYEEYDEGVSVFAGHDSNGEQNMLLQSVSSDLDSEILTIEKRLKTENHFALEEDTKRILERYRIVATSKIVKNVSLYRARIGFEEMKRDISQLFTNHFHYLPYTGNAINAPPPYLAMSGRINRTGVSFLYCATDKHTAISEVRPHPGDHVSLATFRVKHDVSVFDLSDSKLLYFFENDKVLDTYKPFNTLGVLINRTIPPSDQIRYSMTQLIADCIRQLGFNGVVFNSTVGSGKNVVLFDQVVVEQLTNEADIVVIDKVKYNYSQETIVNDDGDYY